MKQLVQEILDFYFLKMRAPDISELSDIKNTPPLNEKGACFITLYSKGEVRGSAGNIKEIYETLAEEILANTFEALTKDNRFSPLKLEEKDGLNFRIDRISQRTMIELEEVKKLDPIKYGVIAIKRDYEKLAVILPNISAKLLLGSDFLTSLEKKLSDAKLSDKSYIFYRIETEVERN
ncbi:AMMECR1 domain-containing protein [Candidatus Gracilibacteria bacterium]|nr:AMMECR1 domain-containing protein [Candidatus Gracilibacteria bacterium]